LATLARTRLTGGVRITPRCGDPPFTSRDLSGYVQKYGNGETPPSVAWCAAGNFFTLPEGTEPRGEQAGATHADFVEGTGLTCSVPPGYKQHGYATQGVQPGIYPYYTP